MAQAHVASGDIIEIRPLGASLTERVTTAFFKSAQMDLSILCCPAARRCGNIAYRERSPCSEGLIEFSTPVTNHNLPPGQMIHLAAGMPRSLLVLSDPRPC